MAAELHSKQLQTEVTVTWVVPAIFPYTNYCLIITMDEDLLSLPKCYPSVHPIELLFITTSGVIWEIFGSLVIVAICFLTLLLGSINVTVAWIVEGYSVCRI